MPWLKHQFDDATPEEAERMDHAETVNAMRAPGLVGLSVRKYHDRKYGEMKLCRWCLEPAIDDIADAFQRPAAEPNEARRKHPGYPRCGCPPGSHMHGLDSLLGPR